MSAQELKTDFDAAFSAVSDTVDLPDWAMNFRRDGLDSFHRQGMPARGNEDWKYTSTRPLQQAAFSLPNGSTVVDPDIYEDVRIEGSIEVVFVNGTYAPELSSIADAPDGITVLPLSDALAQKPDDVRRVLDAFSPRSEDAFSGLNRAFLNQGIFIDVPSNIVCDKPIHVLAISTHDGADIMSFPRILISLGRHAQAEVVEHFISREENLHYFNNVMTDITMDAGSHLAWCRIQDESRGAFHVGTTRILQQADSKLESFNCSTGSRLCRNNLDIVLDGTGIDSVLDGVYLMQDNQHIDNQTTVDHRQPNCVSSQLYKGLLDGHSRGVFNGRIYVRQAAQQTNAYQLNQNLLLSDDARIDTKPQLEIHADDVRCSHGATISQLNEDEIFYLQSRCLQRDVAERILASGYIHDVVYRLKSETLRNVLFQHLKTYFCFKRLGS